VIVLLHTANLSAGEQETARQKSVAAALRANIKRKMSVGIWIGGAALILVAGLLRWWVAPTLERLPSDYNAETNYLATLHSRQTPSDSATKTETTVRRRDQHLSGTKQHAIIQGEALWLSTRGDLIFGTSSIYGVDRYTRENIASYGSEKRVGQYLFPPHIKKQQYEFWDPIYANRYVATFDRVDSFHGIEVFLFKTLADGIDETSGYSSLPDVPKKYRILTYGRGRYWVDPISGVVVDHEDSGESYFVDQALGRRVGEPTNQWSARYTQETILAQLQLAAATRWRIFALELWIPLAFVAAGIMSVAVGFGAARGRAK
jgi:DUF3068 family protein